jgi:hypothetical protein
MYFRKKSFGGGVYLQIAESRRVGGADLDPFDHATILARIERLGNPLLVTNH